MRSFKSLVANPWRGHQSEATEVPDDEPAVESARSSCFPLGCDALHLTNVVGDSKKNLSIISRTISAARSAPISRATSAWKPVGVKARGLPAHGAGRVFQIPVAPAVPASTLRRSVKVMHRPLR